MGGAQHSKHRGRGDAAEITLPRHLPKSRTLTSKCASLVELENSIPPVDIMDGKKWASNSEDEPVEGKWEDLMDGMRMISTPAHVMRNKSNVETSVRTYTHNHNHNGTIGGNQRRGRQIYSKKVLETMPVLPTSRSPMSEHSAHNLFSLIPPKIRLQILSPVHSRQQVRVPSDNKMNVESICDTARDSNNTTDDGSSILFLKQPLISGDQIFELESLQDMMTTSAHISPGQSNHSNCNYNALQQTENYEEKTQSNKPKQLVKNLSKQRRQPPNRPPPPEFQRHMSKKTFSTLPMTQDNEFGQREHNNRTFANLSCSKSSNSNNRKGNNGYSFTKQNELEIGSTSHSQNHSVTPYYNERSETRETTALSQSSSRRKLKVKGLKNFVQSHKPCPPLWAKQFPCRSKFHPDNYLYDFEGFNAPKRPVRAMEKCSKKCGRCSRCGVYVDSVCPKCSMCSADCTCKSKNLSNGHPVPGGSPGPGQFAPTAEHFISQLFGNGWSQTQKIEVNTLAEPDKPRLNLHQASSNNPLKIKPDKPEEVKKPMNATGYDTYTPVPDPNQQQHPAYPPYPYGYGYPGYPAPASPYPYPYYPTYMTPLPPPMPPPYYNYSGLPPMPPPNYNYSATAQ